MKGGNQSQQGDGKGKTFLWFCLMGLQVCLELVHVLLKHTPLHEQRPMFDIIMPMEVG